MKERRGKGGRAMRKMGKILFCRGECTHARMYKDTCTSYRTQTLLSAHAFPRESGASLSDEIYRFEIYSRILSLEQLMHSRAFTIKIKLSFHDREGDHFVQIAVKAARNIYFYIFCYYNYNVRVYDRCWRSFKQ